RPAPSVEGVRLLFPMSGKVTEWFPVTRTCTGRLGLAGRSRGKKRSTSARKDQVAFEPCESPVPPPLLQQGAVPALPSSTALPLMSFPLNFAPRNAEGSGTPLLEMVCQ